MEPKYNESKQLRHKTRNNMKTKFLFSKSEIKHRHFKRCVFDTDVSKSDMM